MSDVAPKHAGSFTELVNLVSKLRAPGGCPWDREQTHESLKPMMLEEAYEVVEAIDDGNDEELIGELGDLLLQVVFHGQIASEQNRFTVSDVIEQVSAKMVRRHPHVFGDEIARTSGEVLKNWEAIKQAERIETGKSDDSSGSMLDSVSRRLPAMMEAYQITTKVARVGFDWPHVADVFEKLDEEVAELQAAAGSAPPAGVEQESSRHAEIAGEIGDVLFVVVNIARQLGVDPESALKASNRKFRRRFNHIEKALRSDGRQPADSSLEEMGRLWDEAKQRERDSEGVRQPHSSR